MWIATFDVIPVSSPIAEVVFAQKAQQLAHRASVHSDLRRHHGQTSKDVVIAELCCFEVWRVPCHPDVALQYRPSQIWRVRSPWVVC
jgi:hypothetical protein